MFTRKSEENDHSYYPQVNKVEKFDERNSSTVLNSSSKQFLDHSFTHDNFSSGETCLVTFIYNRFGYEKLYPSAKFLFSSFISYSIEYHEVVKRQKS